MCEAVGVLEFRGAESESRSWGAVQGPCGYPADSKGGEVGHTLLPGQKTSVPHTEVQYVHPEDLDPAQALATARLLRGRCRSFLWALHSRLSTSFCPIGPDGQPPPFSPRSCGNNKDAIVSFPSETPVKIAPLPGEQVWLQERFLAPLGQSLCFVAVTQGLDSHDTLLGIVLEHEGLRSGFWIQILLLLGVSL